MIYGDLNMAEVSGATVYGKLGLSLVDIETSESLNNGSTLPNEERLLGWTVGIGLEAICLSKAFRISIKRR